MVATRRPLDSGYPTLCGESLREDSMHSTKLRSWTTCECHPAIASRHFAETVEHGTASGSTTSTGSASVGRKRVR